MSNALPELTQRIKQSLPAGITDDLIRKQLIQVAIVKALDDCSALDMLTMQGGSCISGCYGGLRLSEDLNFEMDRLPTMQESEDMAQSIEKAVHSIFDAEVHVKRPTEEKLLNPTGTVPVGKWLTRVEVVERRPDIPRATVKLEIAQVPHQTSVARRFSNMASQSAGFRDSIVLAEDIEELLADKVVSLLAQEKVLRVRDVWDMAYLLRMRPTSRPMVREFVEVKIEAYGLDRQRLVERAEALGRMDWGTLIADQLPAMMITVDAVHDAASPRVAGAIATESFELVRYSLA